jgi:MFS family permease
MEEKETEGELTTPATIDIEEVERSSGAKFTCDQAINAVGFGRFQWFLSLLSGIFICGEAMEVMLMALLLPIIKDEWRLHGWESGVLGGMVFLGMFCGAYAWGHIADIYGRRKSFQLSALWVGVFGLLSAVPLAPGLPDFVWLVFSRGMVGFGVGGFHVSFSFFVEFLPGQWRGPFLSFMSMFFAIGAAIAALLVWFFVSVVGGWRWLLVTIAGPVWVAFFCSNMVCESPRFLLVSGRREEAMKVLKDVAHFNKRELPLGELEDSYAEERGSVWHLLSRTMRRCTLLLWGIWFVNTLTYYGLLILTGETFKGDNEYIAMLLTTCSEFVGVTVAMLTVNLGRKRLMAAGLLCAGVCIFLLLIQWEQLFISVSLILLARTMFTLVVTVAYTYTPEVYPTSLRGVGMGMAFGVARLAGIIAPFLVEILDEKHRAIPVTIFGACAWAAACFSILLPVETSHRKLEDRLTKEVKVQQETEDSFELDSSVFD